MKQLLGHRKAPVQRYQHGAEPVRRHRAGPDNQADSAEDRNAIATADAEFGL